MFSLKSSVSITQLCEFLDAELIGNELQFDNVAPYTKRSKGTLCFSRLSTEPEPEPESENVIIADYSQSTINPGDYTGVHTKEPRLTFIRALEYLEKQVGFIRSTQEAKWHESCVIGANVYLGKNVSIGANTIIEPNVVILDNTQIGEDCLIRANTTIGSDGFGYERLADGTPVKFIHLGGVVVGNNVEIGANTCVAKGTMGNTLIEDNVKIDNLVHIAHNCIIRNGAYIIACAEISGGVEVGENAWVAPNVCVRDTLSIGKGAMVGLGAVVTKDVADEDIVAGNPAKSFKR